MSAGAPASERFYLFSRIWYAICWSLMVTVNLVFMVQVAGLDPLQMVLVGTVLELTVLLFEVPTGVIADTVSRRLSVIVGHAIVGAGFLIIVLWPSFGMILLAQVVWGFGYTFISGAHPAWLTSEVGVGRANQALLRGAQLAHLASFFGIALAVALAHVTLALPIAAGALGLVVLAVVMTVVMREDNFVPAGRAAGRALAEGAASAERDAIASMAGTLRSGVLEIRARPVLALMFLITIVYGAFSEGIDRLFTPYLIQDFRFPGLGALDPVTWWGIIAAVASLCGYLATTLARRHVQVANQQRLTFALAICLAGVSALVLVLANVEGFLLVLVCYWLIGALRAAYDPLLMAWLNSLLPEASRATMLSMYGQADAFGQAAGGPVIGALAKYVSIAFALGTSALSLLPTLPLFRRLARGLERDQQRAPAAGGLS